MDNMQAQEEKVRLCVIFQRLEFEKYGHRNPEEMIIEYGCLLNKWRSENHNILLIKENTVLFEKFRKIRVEIEAIIPLFDARLRDMWIDTAYSS